MTKCKRCGCLIENNMVLYCIWCELELQHEEDTLNA